MITKKPSNMPFPPATLVLAALNFAVFALVSAGQSAEVLHTWGLVPQRFLADISSSQPLVIATACITPLTSLFLHELDWTHVVFNMVAFLLFAPAVEKRLGTRRFVALYLITGLAANAFFLAMVADGKFGSIGASAAVCGVLGAYMLLFFSTRWIKSLVPFALLCLTVLGTQNPQNVEATGFTHWMHLAGFAVGAIAAGVLTVELTGARRPVTCVKV